MILFFFFIHTWCLLLDLVFAAGISAGAQGLVERVATLLLGDELAVPPGWVGYRLCGDQGHAPQVLCVHEGAQQHVGLLAGAQGP